MTAYDHTTPSNSRLRGSLLRVRARIRAATRSRARRLARPYVELRAREHDLETRLGRAETELAHVRDRHGEQIERLEDLTRELVLAVEAVRRDVEPGTSAAADPRERAGGSPAAD